MPIRCLKITSSIFVPGERIHRSRKGKSGHVLNAFWINFVEKCFFLGAIYMGIEALRQLHFFGVLKLVERQRSVLKSGHLVLRLQIEFVQ
jgi:hypothetical protein